MIYGDLPTLVALVPEYSSSFFLLFLLLLLCILQTFEDVFFFLDNW